MITIQRVIELMDTTGIILWRKTPDGYSWHNYRKLWFHSPMGWVLDRDYSRAMVDPIVDLHEHKPTSLYNELRKACSSNNQTKVRMRMVEIIIENHQSQLSSIMVTDNGNKDNQ